MADAGGTPPADPARLDASSRRRYAGTALVGLAILLYWCGKVFVAWLSG